MSEEGILVGTADHPSQRIVMSNNGNKLFPLRGKRISFSDCYLVAKSECQDGNLHLVLIAKLPVERLHEQIFGFSPPCALMFN